MALSLDERKMIEKYQGQLVREAENLVENAGISGKLKDNQLRGVANVAMSAECVPVITNFIKYQSAREKKWNDGNFRENVISKLNSFEDTAKTIAPNNVDEAWIELCRSFWGYVIRYAKFKEKGGLR